jgi:hypothetical protein
MINCHCRVEKKKLAKTPRKKNVVNHPRIELGPNAWKASILTIILAILDVEAVWPNIYLSNALDV